jgi:hypothetical protein
VASTLYVPSVSVSFKIGVSRSPVTGSTLQANRISTGVSMEEIMPADLISVKNLNQMNPTKELISSNLLSMRLRKQKAFL